MGGISFPQKPWLKPYMQLNTELRQMATQQFEIIIFKLMNNCIYGESMENVRKYRDIKLVNVWEGRFGARRYIAKPNFKSIKIIDEDLATIELSTTSVTMDKPIYLGQVILVFSKSVMYRFLYEFAKRHFEDVSLLYMDTDSYIYHIRHCNPYDVMRQHSDRFDT